MAAADTMRVLLMTTVLMLAGCEHDRYLDRRDSVTFGAGNAIAANKAIQIIDPWPQDARTISHGMSGEQAVAAMEKFRRRTAGPQPSGAPQSMTLVPATAPATPPAP
jgi:hypothetical protein